MEDLSGILIGLLIIFVAVRYFYLGKCKLSSQTYARIGQTDQRD